MPPRPRPGPSSYRWVIAAGRGAWASGWVGVGLAGDILESYGAGGGRASAAMAPAPPEGKRYCDLVAFARASADLTVGKV